MVSRIKIIAAQFLTAVVLCSGNLRAADQSFLEAGIAHPTVKIWETRDPEVVVYRIFFNLRITNRGKENVNVGSTPILVLSAQNRESDGTWINLNQNSWYDDGTVRYGSCSLLSPGKSVTIPNVEVALSLLRTKLTKIGGEPVLRFQLQIQCEQPDGTIGGTPTFTTGPVTIKLSSSSGGRGAVWNGK